MRRFEPLTLIRARSPLFALTWTVLHVIDEASPLHGVTEERLKSSSGQILVVLSGLDETFAQRIHARHAYSPGEIVWNQHFADVIFEDEKGVRVLDYKRFHDLEEISQGDLAPEIEIAEEP